MGSTFCKPSNQTTCSTATCSTATAEPCKGNHKRGNGQRFGGITVLPDSPYPHGGFGSIHTVLTVEPRLLKQWKITQSDIPMLVSKRCPLLSSKDQAKAFDAFMYEVQCTQRCHTPNAARPLTVPYVGYVLHYDAHTVENGGRHVSRKQERQKRNKVVPYNGAGDDAGPSRGLGSLWCAAGERKHRKHAEDKTNHIHKGGAVYNELVLRACRGVDLATEIPNVCKGRMYYTFDTVMRYALQMANCIQHCHMRGVIHCDIKPENFIVDVQGFMTLCDFGLAQFRDDTDGKCPHGALRGSRSYIAPESVTRGEYTSASDWWAFGLILYELLFGRQLFTDSVSLNAERFDNFKFAVPWTTRCAERTPVELRQLLQHILCIDSRKRPAGHAIIECLDKVRDMMIADEMFLYQ